MAPSTSGEPLWVWMGQRGSDAIGLNRLVPIRLVVCCDDLPEAAWRGELEAFSLERETGNRRSLSNEALNSALEGDLGRRLKARLAAHKGPVFIVAYRSTRWLERLAAGRPDVTILAPPVRWKNHFDDKIRFRRAMAKLGIPTVPGMVRKDHPGFGEIVRELGCPFVVTERVGSSGRQSAWIRDEETYLNWCRTHPDQEVIYTRYLEAPSVNVNACVAEGEGGPIVHIGRPSVQLVGLEWCGAGPLVYCGNDYGAAEDLPSEVHEEIKAQTRVIGRWVTEKPFRGVFGADFLIHDGRSYPLEVNPRFQNSTQLLTQLECLEGRVPLVLHHLRQFVPGLAVSECGRGGDRQIPAAQIILYHTGPAEPWEGNWGPGTYVREKGGLRFYKRETFVSGKAEEIVVDGLPGAVTVLHPDAPLCRVQFSRRIASSDLRGVLQEIKDEIKDLTCQ